MITITEDNDKNNFITSVFKVYCSNGQYGSGSLLSLGGNQYVLTAAHVVCENTNGFLGWTIKSTPTLRPEQFTCYNSLGDSWQVSDIYVFPNYHVTPGFSLADDIALIKLAKLLPLLPAYEIYRDTNEFGKEITTAGWSGKSGFVQFNNSLDMPSSDTTLLYYDDDSTIPADRNNLNSVGVDNEDLLEPGMSGGPNLIDSKIAGINSMMESTYFGRLARVSAYASWIDEVTSGKYSTKDNPVYQPPKTKAEVMLNVPEVNNGYVVNYFLASFNYAVSTDITFDYKTVDGTALENHDYTPVSGRATIHKGESYVVIPVNILGDMLVENTETFSLEVNNFVGYTLPDGIIKLVATHNIIDNDAFSIT